MSVSGRRLPPFRVVLRPSRLGPALTWGCAVAAVLLCLLYLPVVHWWACLPAMLGALRCQRALPRAGSLQVELDGRMFAEEGGRRLELTLSPDSFVMPWLTVVNAVADGRRRSWVLLPDSANADSLRKLRVYLSWFHSARDLHRDAPLTDS
ncbi:protein YgfX [uncultured Aquitalea sp.]|uniref:protein YgfX n=1 Tax=uncultured Aquitalea sp. TaxID=540272 RepID=UPI0025F22B96|nr:protein YgfX [uncultured Aquitalea sp.]